MDMSLAQFVRACAYAHSICFDGTLVFPSTDTDEGSESVNVCLDAADRSVEINKDTFKSCVWQPGYDTALVTLNDGLCYSVGFLKAYKPAW